MAPMGKVEGLDESSKQSQRCPQGPGSRPIFNPEDHKSFNPSRNLPSNGSKPGYQIICATKACSKAFGVPVAEKSPFENQEMAKKNGKPFDVLQNNQSIKTPKNDLKFQQTSSESNINAKAYKAGLQEPTEKTESKPKHKKSLPQLSITNQFCFGLNPSQVPTMSFGATMPSDGLTTQYCPSHSQQTSVQYKLCPLHSEQLKQNTCVCPKNTQQPTQKFGSSPSQQSTTQDQQKPSPSQKSAVPKFKSLPQKSSPDSESTSQLYPQQSTSKAKKAKKATQPQNDKYFPPQQATASQLSLKLTNIESSSHNMSSSQLYFDFESCQQYSPKSKSSSPGNVADGISVPSQQSVQQTASCLSSPHKKSKNKCNFGNSSSQKSLTQDQYDYAASESSPSQAFFDYSPPKQPTPRSKSSPPQNLNEKSYQNSYHSPQNQQLKNQSSFHLSASEVSLKQSNADSPQAVSSTYQLLYFDFAPPQEYTQKSNTSPSHKVTKRSPNNYPMQDNYPSPPIQQSPSSHQPTPKSYFGPAPHEQAPHQQCRCPPDSVRPTPQARSAATPTQKHGYNNSLTAQARSGFASQQQQTQKPLNGYMSQQSSPQCYFGPSPQQGYAPQQSPKQGYAPQETPQQGYAPQQSPKQGYAPQQSPQQVYAPQQSPKQGYGPQQPPQQGCAPQQSPKQGYVPQQVYSPQQPPQQECAPQKSPKQGYVPQQGYSPQQSPQQGYAPQQSPKQGYAPQEPPQQGYAPQQSPKQGYDPQQSPQQGYAPQKSPKQGYGPQQPPEQGCAPQQSPKQGYVPQQGYSPQQSPQQGYAPQQSPKQGYAPQQSPQQACDQRFQQKSSPQQFDQQFPQQCEQRYPQQSTPQQCDLQYQQQSIPQQCFSPSPQQSSRQQQCDQRPPQQSTQQRC